MKTTRFCMLAFLFCFYGKGYGEDIKVIKSKLDEATVFFKGAELIHSASTTLSKGDNELVIEGLSAPIDKNSLKIKASNGVIVSGFEYSIDYLSETKTENPSIQQWQDSIDIYKRWIEKIETDTKIDSNLLNLLQKGIDKNVSGSEKGLGIDELIKTMDYYKNQSTDIAYTQIKNKQKKEEYSQAIEKWENQLKQESTKNNKTSGVLKLTLSSPATTSCQFTITYYTQAARWTPYYDILVESTERPIKIASKAKVRQTSGLDWNKVKLTLSSATPSFGKVAPLFRAWFLDYTQPIVTIPKEYHMEIAQNAYSYTQKPAKKKPAAETSSRNSGDEPVYVVDGEVVDLEYIESLDPDMIKELVKESDGMVNVTLKSMNDYVTQAETELNLVYNIDLPYSIPGSGKEQSIPLQVKEVAADYQYYCAPKLDPGTYLLAEIQDWQKLGLLSGKANITYEGTYVGETYIDAASTAATLSLTLGADKRIIVKREKMKDYSSTKFLGNDIKQVFTYKLTVKNNRNRSIKMVLKEQYPISSQKNIEVELLEETSSYSFNKEEVGVITWEEDFSAGETKTYQISYNVKYPKNRRLNL